jgi:hypothetical protein
MHAQCRQRHTATTGTKPSSTPASP